MSALPDWQHGHDLEKLRRLAAPFREAHRRLCFGAFSLVREADIALAIEAQEIVHTPAGGALFRRLKRPGSFTDFTGRAHEIPEGALYCRAFAAGSTLEASALLHAMDSRRDGGPFYVEIFEEDPVAKIVVPEIFSYVASKITAGGEVKGVYRLGYHESEIDKADERTLSILERDFLSPEDLAEIRAELDAFAPWAQHYSSYNKRSSWQAFSLRGYQADPAFVIKPAEMSLRWKAEHVEMLSAKCEDTEAAARFPATMLIARGLAPELDRVRFMRLEAGGGELSRHADITDREAGTADGKVVRLHFPIWTNAGVRFCGWSARGEECHLHMPEGAMCYLDQRKPHTARNGGDAARVHLVVDVRSNDQIREMLRAAAA